MLSRIAINGFLCLLCFIYFALAGCTKYVYVPVWSCPYGDIPKKQELKTKNISDQTKTSEIVRAMTYDILYLEGYSNQLIKLLEGYNSPPPDMLNPNKPK